MNLPTFEDQVVLVTDGSSGIGRSTVLAFASQGASVIFASRGVEAGMALQTEINKSGGKALYIQADMANSVDIETLIAKTIQAYGRIDHAVNNATPSGTMTQWTVSYSLGGG
jgi:NAD(P)-dependent dehydrogenase (short-subunit alcohol dehydrogenase family)